MSHFATAVGPLSSPIDDHEEDESTRIRKRSYPNRVSKLLILRDFVQILNIGFSIFKDWKLNWKSGNSIVSPTKKWKACHWYHHWQGRWSSLQISIWQWNLLWNRHCPNLWINQQLFGLEMVKQKWRITEQAQCLKITKNVAFEFFILAFSTNFRPNKSDLSGNTVWPQASGFQKLAKMDHFCHF